MGKMKLISTSPMGHFFKFALVYSYLACFINAGAFGQDKGEDVKLNVKGTNITLAQAFLQIKKQTGLTVFYNNQLLNDKEKVSIDLKNTSLGTVLNTLLKGKNIGYEIRRDKVIVLNNKPTPAIPANKQESTYLLKGKVADSETNETLIGVSIVVKSEKNRMSVTDRNGNFSIRVSKSDVLTFMYVGYSPIDVPVANVNNDPIRLKPSTSALDEVVIIGYGEVKRSDLTGSVAEVKVKDIQKAPVATFDQALAGRVAGVQVTSNEGQPGSPSNIVIRGGNSLTQSNSPLYVIDGFPMEDPSLASINAQDIKSINILKDASATAIYGSRGANGVVVIETKDGKVGKTTFSYDANFGIQKVTEKMDLMSPYEFVKYQAEFDPVYAEKAFLKDGITSEYYKDVKGIDWQDKLFRDGLVQNHSLAINGGNTSTKFSISGNITDHQGAIINSGFNRYQGRAYFNHNANKKLSFNLQINYAKDKSYGDLASTNTSGTQPYASFLLYRVWGYRPLNAYGSTMDLENEFIDSDGNDARFNPIIDYSNSVNDRSNENFNFNGNAWYKILPNLTLKVKGGLNSRTLEESSFYNALTSRGSSLSTANTKGVNGGIRFTNYKTWVNENTLTYRPKLKKGQSLTGLIGWTIQGDIFKRFGLSGEYVPNELLGLYGIDEGTPGANTATISENYLMSYLGRVDYSLNDKYLLTASLRSDGSSKFAKENRWSYFPSAAFAWKLKNEKFMNSLSFISDAKLRTSYGLTGNNRIGNYAIFSEMGLPYTAYYSFGNSVSQGIQLNTFGNKNLKWETTEQVDLGIDLSLFKNRVNLTVDWYKKTTRDLLLKANVPYSSGYSNIFKNIGKVSNQGFEFSLSTINIDGKSFRWESDFNISFNRNKILALAEDETRLLNTVSWGNHGQTNLFIAQLGGPIAQFYGLMFDGLYQIDDFTWQNNSDPSIQHNARSYTLKKGIPTNGSSVINPGDIKYVDVNGDGIVNLQDNVIIGRGLPIHTGGFNNNFSYKSFSLNVFFQWSYGNDVMNANRIYLEGNDASRSALNQFATYANRWTFENQNSNIPRAKGQGPSGYYSSRTLEDGSYLRLKTVALSYSLPSVLTKKLKVEDISIYASAQNLFTWTNYSGMDPEVSTRNSALTPGLDYSSYPRMKIFTLGFKTSF
ncbi:MAG: TonB-dependent receptor [Pedobacter sp.]|uniref:TonB-dependent receptor n=1 Tax=Pedobacter sp. TaxID=1411316 RepID=UPI003569B80F